MRRGRNALGRRPAGYMDRRNALAMAERAGENNRLRAGAFDALTARGVPAASAAALSSALDYVPVVGDVSGGEDAFQAFRSGDMLGGAVALGATALGAVPVVGDAAAKGVKKGIRAFHGSPHDFDRFSLDKIGTGEGAQAYGHGLYFAESEGVARSYRDALSDTVHNVKIDGRSVPQLKDSISNPRDQILSEIGVQYNHHGNFEKALNFVRRQHESALTSRRTLPENLENHREALTLLDEISKNPPQIEKAPGRMYEVNINANPDEFLDWDRPLSEQPENAKLVFDEYINSYVDHRYGEEELTGEQFFRQFERNDSALEQEFSKAGIPGIRYLDAGSRGAGEGSRNYVVFDDSLVEILRKYGIGGLTAGGGAYGLTQQELEQAQTEGLI